MPRSPLLPLSLPLIWAGAATAQTTPGAELWRVAAVTLPIPAALNTGVTATFWNPGQPVPDAPRVGLEVIQTPDAVGASGLLAAVRAPIPLLGSIGLVYGRMGLSDLVRTTDSPNPDGATIPFYNQDLKLVWAGTRGGLTIGASLAYRDTRFDGVTMSGWGIDVGLAQRVGNRMRLAASTRGLRRLSGDPAQDVFAGIEYQAWRGTLWHGTPGAVRARYGVSGGRRAGLDHQIGAGIDVGTVLALDAELSREVSYGHAAWRGAAGLRVAVGRYRLTFARDGGVSDIGSAYRVGLEARLR
jgi:hypothetical protein